MYVVGMSFYGEPFSTHGGWSEQNEIGRVWSRWMAFFEGSQQKLQPIIYPGVFYEIHVYDEETVAKGIFEVFVGARLKTLESVPLALLIKALPAGDYARFTLEGSAISGDWDFAVDRWIAEAGYQRAHPFSIQYYDERFKGIDNLEASILDVYIPVELRFDACAA
jgi:predicted transcriptional regulator YdeE